MKKPPVFVCKCQDPKKFSLTFDGGPTGTYQLVLCSACYSKEDKLFLISEKVIKN